MIQFASLSMILCLCLTNGSTRLSTLTVQHPSPHPTPPTKRGIPRMCPAVPPMSPILPSSSNIHCLSLSLKDHYCQGYDWTHGDGCMALLFHRVFIFYFLLYRCIIHHHTTVPFERECHETRVIFPLLVEESLKVLLLDWELNWWRMLCNSDSHHS